MQDVQNEYDQREISIDQVGVKDLEYPITIEDKAQGYQNTVARITMSVHLPHQFRGTHMSRFIEILNAYRGFLSEASIFKMLDEIQTRLDSHESYFQAEFPYFIEKKAPVSGALSLMNYQGIFMAEKKKWQTPSFILGVRVPLTSLCPCSREISQFGA
ncbi:MAG: GTP cyclohydrolase I FolE2, partial [Candidatus Delongbacteria bacterium]|nr:GTP cyclohydrolase I FolE2 [Candidatus Delongbacteria bacterium]